MAMTTGGQGILDLTKGGDGQGANKPASVFSTKTNKRFRSILGSLGFLKPLGGAQTPKRKPRKKQSEGGRGCGDSCGKLPCRVRGHNMVVDLFLNAVGATCLLLPGAWPSKTKTKQGQFLFVLFIVLDWVRGLARELQKVSV